MPHSGKGYAFDKSGGDLPLTLALSRSDISSISRIACHREALPCLRHGITFGKSECFCFAFHSFYLFLFRGAESAEWVARDTNTSGYTFGKAKLCTKCITFGESEVLFLLQSIIASHSHSHCFCRREASAGLASQYGISFDLPPVFASRATQWQRLCHAMPLALMPLRGKGTALHGKAKLCFPLSTEVTWRNATATNAYIFCYKYQ